MRKASEVDFNSPIGNEESEVILELALLRLPTERPRSFGFRRVPGRGFPFGRRPLFAKFMVTNIGGETFRLSQNALVQCFILRVNFTERKVLNYTLSCSSPQSLSARCIKVNQFPYCCG